MLFGSVSDTNKSHAPGTDPEGYPLQAFGSLDPTKPYLELGYGIENIFKFFRVDFFHRMTYMDNPATKPLAIKVSAQIIF